MTAKRPIDYIVSMTERKIYDKEGHAHYVTFICYKRRRLLDDSMASIIVIGVLNDQLKKQKGACSGFVIMPDHVHAIVWFTESNQISHFMKQWKHRTSYQIKQSLSKYLNNYWLKIPQTDQVWQPKYYDFNLYSSSKLLEKLEYIHNNPVRVGLVERPEQWIYCSARYYILGKPVGLPLEFPY